MSTEQATSVVGPQSSAPAQTSEAPEAAVVETPVAATPPEKTKEELEFAARFAALTRREKAILNQQRTLSEKSKDLEALNKYEEAKKSAKQNPIAVLESLGLDYKYLTDYILNDNKPTTEGLLGTLQEKVQALQNQLAEKEQMEKQLKNEQTINQFKYSIKSHVDNNADAFELIRANDAYETVFEVASNVFDETNEVPDIDEVARQVESYLEGEVEKLTKVKKVLNKFAPPVPQASPEIDTKPSLSKTLTNANVSSVPETSKKILSPDDSVRRAAAMLKWN